jgi:hypothetical protein
MEQRFGQPDTNRLIDKPEKHRIHLSVPLMR